MADDFMSGFLAGQGNGNSNRGGMFGGDGWWAIIIFALIFGWGNGGYGFGGGNSGGVADGYVLASDFANVERKIDAVNNGYTLVGKYCGRDKNGVFKCVCGKCYPFPAKATIDTTAAMTAATAEMAEITVFIINRSLSVFSFDAGVSTN